jgi:ribosomal protein S15P/S13E
MKLVRAVKTQAFKGVIYGPPGIGKSTFLSQTSDPVFIDTDKRAGNLEVRPMVPEDEPKSYADVVRFLGEFTRGKVQGVDTIVIDTADWLEAWLAADICQKNKKKSLSDFSWGSGYQILAEEWRNTLAILDQVVGKGTNVWVAGHSQVSMFHNPLGQDYDRYSMKLTRTKNVDLSAMLFEWSSVCLFADFDTIAVEVSGKNIGMNGEKRVIHTQRCGAFDAKTNFNLPAKMPLDYGVFSEHMKVANTEEDVSTIIERIRALTEEPEHLESIERNKKNPRNLLKLESFLKQKKETNGN